MYVSLDTWEMDAGRYGQKNIASASEATMKVSQTCITDSRQQGYFRIDGKGNIPLTCKNEVPLRQQSRTPKYVLQVHVSLNTWEIDVGRSSGNNQRLPKM